MNHLTNEERAKVFAMYLGCAVKLTEEPMSSTEPNILEAVNIGGAFWTNEDDESSGNEFEAGKLCLFPLSAITDEHAIEVSQILDTPGDCVERREKYIAVYGKYNDNADVTDTLRLHFINNYELLHLDEYGRGYEFDLCRCSFVHQQLVSWAYAVPLFFGPNHWANGKTAIELGIATINNL